MTRPRLKIKDVDTYRDSMETLADICQDQRDQIWIIKTEKKGLSLNDETETEKD